MARITRRTRMTRMARMVRKTRRKRGEGKKDRGQLLMEFNLESYEKSHFHSLLRLCFGLQ